MNAELLIRACFVYSDGGVVEVVVWRVPTPVPPSGHGFMYRLVYASRGERLIGYDNERGKGDHRHAADAEEPITFISVDNLLGRFVLEVEELRRNR